MDSKHLEAQAQPDTEVDELLETLGLPLPQEKSALHHWFWLRLASCEYALRDSAAIEAHVRKEAAALGFLEESAIAELGWDDLVAKLQAHSAAVVPDAQRFHRRLRERLAPLVGAMELDATACDILIFGTAMWRCRQLDQLGRAFTLDGPDDVVTLVAAAIDAKEESVARALHPLSPLKSCCLLTPRSLVTGVGQAVEPLRVLRTLLYTAEPLEQALVRRFCPLLDVAPKPGVDLAHASDSAQFIQAFLRTGPSARVLLHGRPGAGTSELVREVVRRLGWEAYGADLKRVCENQFLNDHELGAAVVHSVLRRRPKSLVVFDHATDILRSSQADFRKYLDLLEIPTIWTADSLEMIDDDILSRFDYVLEVEPPPRLARVALLRGALVGTGASDAVIDRVAGGDEFTPADVVRLARAVPALVEQGIEADVAIDALAARPGRRSHAPASPVARRGLPYRMEWIQANADLGRLAEGLARTGAGTLLFSGPPGTGKTEFARHLAARLDRQLLIRGAADLNQQFVGQTEKAMARAFDEARRDGSILLIDEVDSFLRSRESAVRTWEISQVNEMLTQLDRFEGIAIFTTNALDSLDSAVMRRIDRKIEFDYIAPQYRWEVFVAAAAVLEVPVQGDDGLLGRRVRSLSGLALGDVAVVLRGERLERTIFDAEGVCRALSTEIGRRLGTRSPVGFVAL